MDYPLLKTIEALSERPLEYEYQHPIRQIERALACGLAEASEPYRAWLRSGSKCMWRMVRKVSVSARGQAVVVGQLTPEVK